MHVRLVVVVMNVFAMRLSTLHLDHDGAYTEDDDR